MLVSKLNPRRPRVWHVRSKKVFRNICSTEFVVLNNPTDECSPEFYHYYIQSNEVMSILEALATGSTNSHTRFRPEDLKSLSVAKPVIQEQQKIASILSSVDRVIDLTEQEINKLKDLKKGMMQKLLTKGIGHTKFKDSPVGRIPESWSVESLSKMCTLVDCEHKTAPYVDDSKKYFVCRTSNVRGGRFDLSDAKYTTGDGYKEWTSRAVPKAGDFIFTREAPAGEVAMIPENMTVCLGQRTVLLQPNPDIVYSNFLSFCFYSAAVRKGIELASIGTTVTRINMADIAKIKMPLPNMDEQKEISDALYSLDKNILSKEAKKSSIEKVKKGLMQDLLTGKVRVKV